MMRVIDAIVNLWRYMGEWYEDTRRFGSKRKKWGKRDIGRKLTEAIREGSLRPKVYESDRVHGLRIKAIVSRRRARGLRLVSSEARRSAYKREEAWLHQSDRKLMVSADDREEIQVPYGEKRIFKVKAGKRYQVVSTGRPWGKSIAKCQIDAEEDEYMGYYKDMLYRRIDQSTREIHQAHPELSHGLITEKEAMEIAQRFYKNQRLD